MIFHSDKLTEHIQTDNNKLNIIFSFKLDPFWSCETRVVNVLGCALRFRGTCLKWTKTVVGYLEMKLAFFHVCSLVDNTQHGLVETV